MFVVLCRPSFIWCIFIFLDWAHILSWMGKVRGTHFFKYLIRNFIGFWFVDSLRACLCPYTTLGALCWAKLKPRGGRKSI